MHYSTALIVSMLRENNFPDGGHSDKYCIFGITYLPFQTDIQYE